MTWQCEICKYSDNTGKFCIECGNRRGSMPFNTLVPEADKTVEKYCQQCGTKLISNQCPFCLLGKVPPQPSNTVKTGAGERPLSIPFEVSMADVMFLRQYDMLRTKLRTRTDHLDSLEEWLIVSIGIIKALHGNMQPGEMQSMADLRRIIEQVRNGHDAESEVYSYLFDLIDRYQDTDLLPMHQITIFDAYILRKNLLDEIGSPL